MKYFFIENFKAWRKKLKKVLEDRAPSLRRDGQNRYFEIAASLEVIHRFSTVFLSIKIPTTEPVRWLSGEGTCLLSQNPHRGRWEPMSTNCLLTTYSSVYYLFSFICVCAYTHEHIHACHSVCVEVRWRTTEPKVDTLVTFLHILTGIMRVHTYTTQSHKTPMTFFTGLEENKQTNKK